MSRLVSQSSPQIAAGLILVLWSQMIGLEDLPVEPAVPASDKPNHVPETAPKGDRQLEKSPKLNPRNTLPTNRGFQVDPDLFLRSFKRQAAGDLTSCLLAQEKDPSNDLSNDRSLGLSAVLDAGGHLKSLTVIDPLKTLSECARKAIFAMDFATLTTHLPKGATVTVQWRLDW